MGTLLSLTALQAREKRKRFQPPASFFQQTTPGYAEIWFPTGGCPWDALGHCTTCNYGAPDTVAPDQMVRAVEAALAEIGPETELLWVSAFDTLHSREVPPEARREIFRLLGSSPARTVITEAHPASVKADAVAECVKLLNGRRLVIQLGVETMDEFVRFACVNKPFTNARLQRAVDTIRDAGAETWANLLVGIPFLSRAEVVAGAAESIDRALETGFGAVVLFPNHVKEHTITQTLAEARRYEPPDLWVLRDVLDRVPEELYPRVHFAWLELKDHPGAADVPLRPVENETQELLRLLERFNMDRDLEALSEALALEHPGRPSAVGTEDPGERLTDHYRWLAERYAGAEWWQRHEQEVSEEIATGLAGSSLGRTR